MVLKKQYFAFLKIITDIVIKKNLAVIYLGRPRHRKAHYQLSYHG
jgi:hypothetical protein